MFKAKIKAEILKETVNIISTIVDEVKLNLENGNMNLRAVDPAHVAMLDLKLKKDAFISYKATQDNLGVDVDKIKETLKLATSGDVIEMEHDEKKNKLILRVGNITRRIALIDTSSMSDAKIPSLNLPSNMVLNVSELKRGIKASEPVSDHVALLLSSDGFEMTAEGDSDSMRLKLPKALLTELDCKENQKSLYSLDYFASMVKFVNSDVKLSIGSDYPVVIEFDIADGNGKVMYLLAPRIEDA